MATPQFVSVKGKQAVLYRDGKRPVYLMPAPDGRFAVHWNGDWRLRTTLAAIDKLTNANRPSVKLFQVADYQVGHDCSTKVLDVAAMEENRLIGKDGKRHYRGYGSWYVFDQQRVDRLNDLEKRRKAAEKAFYDEFKEIMKGARSVSSYNLKDAIAGTLEREEGEEE